MWEEVTVEEGWGWAVEGRGVSTLSRELERVWQDSPVVGQQVRRLLSMGDFDLHLQEGASA